MLMLCDSKVMAIVVALATVASYGTLAQGQESSKIPRIGYVRSFGSGVGRQYTAFQQGLRDLGYIEGKNILTEFRSPQGNLRGEISELVRQLVQLKVDLIVAVDPTAIRAATQATRTIPIVMITNQDPIAAGLVQSLARPGGNITGITRLTRELSGKRLELLKEMLPSVSRVGVLWVQPTALGTGTAFKNYQAAADALKIQLVSLQVSRPNPNLVGAFQTATKDRVGALIAVSHAVLMPHRDTITALASTNRLPLMCESRQFVDIGCLMSYNTDDDESDRRAAVYVDKILKGASPAELPIEQPIKFELTFNLKTAKQIGLVIPPNVLVRADRVIR
jgi:putative ABC transport system substrate-binding protein